MRIPRRRTSKLVPRQEFLRAWFGLQPQKACGQLGGKIKAASIAAAYFNLGSLSFDLDPVSHYPLE